MTSPPVSELTERARTIFRLVVEGYLDSGQPVGSKTLAEGGINLSPASIRSVLSELEALGLLAAPHTSAGRMPTELGLRLFVDGMMQVAEPTAEERAAIERRLDPGPPVAGNAYAQFPAQQPSWPGAIEDFLASGFAAEWYGEQFRHVYGQQKRREMLDFHAQVTDLDYAWYLRTV